MAGLRNEAPIQVDGVTVVCDLADTRFPHVLAEAAGRMAEDAVLRELLGPGDTFLDVGANHGCYSLRAARYIGESGTVLAFEPQPGLARLVERSLSYTGVRRIQVHAVACGDQPGTAVLHVEPASSGSATLHGAEWATGVTTVDVPVQRLDDLVSAQAMKGRLVMKLDVEGHELSALRGAERLLATARPAILLELSPDNAERSGHSLSELLAFLAEQEYEVAELDSFPQAVGPLDHPTRDSAQRRRAARFGDLASTASVIAYFATQGTGSGDEQRMRALLEHCSSGAPSL